VRTTCCSGSRDPKAEAEEIKQRLTKFMRNDPHLELSDEKTLITRTSAAAFLGYENTTQTGTGGRKPQRPIALRVPTSLIKTSCASYLACGKPAAVVAGLCAEQRANESAGASLFACV
jgi:hypothetical protein